MLLNRAYYALKPLLPHSVRLPVRRWWAHRRFQACSASWPIDACAGTAPPGWPGWPEGKRFAFVLTHDVEGSRGLARVERLADLDRAHGFRSSFNFVPEGEYRVRPELRNRLAQAGFEVGVHGLEHDGKLYNSKAAFAAKAARIRQYMADWGAVGFRSPLMQHRLSWLHQLHAEYDASTFDTDPFEPEPDGVRTIFPFWVPAPGSQGYVELPYTLVQDFTLFVVLREPNIDIWKRKLDWIVERGGMALLNTHPDYMCFEGRKGKYEFSADLYAEFLQYVKDRYEGSYWSALPREVARHFCSANPPEARNTRRRICMLAYTQYEQDNRVRRYAETLAGRGDAVDVIALSAKSSESHSHSSLKGVDVYRVQQRDQNERHAWTYAFRLTAFLVRSSIVLFRKHRRVRYDLVHIHNMPDFLVYAAWYPKLDGAKLILDIHDLVPELYANKFGAHSAGASVGILKWIEKSAARFVDHVIISNHLWYEKLIARSVLPAKSSVFVNHVDTTVFYPHPHTRVDDRFIIVFPGSFQWHQGLDIAVRALAKVTKEVPGAEFHLYGGGGGRAQSDLTKLARDLGLNGTVKFLGKVPLDRIPEVMAQADLGVVPKRADSFGNEAYSTKIMEFMSQGVPVVASRTAIDTYYFNDRVVRFFPSGDVDALADAIVELARRKDLRDAQVAAGYEYVACNNWELRKQEYFDLVDRLSTEPFDGPVSLIQSSESVAG
jgi:glycosyltransferase involved in cell wall biosynthesis/peptidoglycan/xylan/chitin deacetylase (PgdA/CDA1 family)